MGRRWTPSLGGAQGRSQRVALSLVGAAGPRSQGSLSGVGAKQAHLPVQCPHGTGLKSPSADEKPGPGAEVKDLGAVSCWRSLGSFGRKRHVI